MKTEAKTKRAAATGKLLETLRTDELVASWKADFGIDVAHLFEETRELAFWQDPESGPMRFSPAIEGDAAFYQALREFDWYHPPTKEEFVAAAHWHEAGAPVLDIGAGDAGFASHVDLAVYCGLETDPAAAKAGAQRGLDMRNMDMATYRAADGQSAQLVTAFQVLEHVAEPDGFVQQMVSLARPGGYVAIGVPDAASYVAHLPDFMLNAPPHHLTWWTEAALEKTLVRAGIRVKAIYRFDVEPWERQLWWMARLAQIARPAKLGYFGSPLRARKVASYLGSYLLQVLPVPKRARGSTLLMVAQKPGSDG